MIKDFNMNGTANLLIGLGLGFGLGFLFFRGQGRTFSFWTPKGQVKVQVPQPDYAVSPAVIQEKIMEGPRLGIFDAGSTFEQDQRAFAIMHSLR